MFLSVTNTYTANNAPQGRISPIYQYSDTMTWLRGRHAFKAGFEGPSTAPTASIPSTSLPGATTGAGNVPFVNISTIAGIGTNSDAGAEHAGRSFGLAGQLDPGLQFGGRHESDLHSGRAGAAHLAAARVRRLLPGRLEGAPNVTLNLGVRYDYYGAPFEANGKAVIPVNGTAGAFGLSGSIFADAFQAGAPGRLADAAATGGAAVAEPRRQIYKND